MMKKQNRVDTINHKCMDTDARFLINICTREHRSWLEAGAAKEGLDTALEQSAENEDFLD